MLQFWVCLCCLSALYSDNGLTAGCSSATHLYSLFELLSLLITHRKCFTSFKKKRACFHNNCVSNSVSMHSITASIEVHFTISYPMEGNALSISIPNGICTLEYTMLHYVFPSTYGGVVIRSKIIPSGRQENTHH